jgi:hypothetical protein
MLMVIFGAGASYDSCSSFPPAKFSREAIWFRPPLAKELFLPVPQFRRWSRNSRFQPLLPYLEARDDVEQILEDIRAKGEGDEECRRQLWAIRYYLADLIRSCQTEWTEHTFGASNHKTLLDQIRESPQACLVTFNYDKMLEQALERIEVPLESMGDYVSHPKYNLIKLHGSIDWPCWIRKLSTSITQNHQPSPAEMIHAAPVLSDDIIIGKVDPRKTQLEVYFQFPALAIPTISKATFVCPPEHLSALTSFIPTVTKILVIGWRAAEEHFLKMLGNIQQDVNILAVCGPDMAEGVRTLQQIWKAGVPGDGAVYAGGFSDFVVERGAQQFLRTGVVESTRYYPLTSRP